MTTTSRRSLSVADMQAALEFAWRVDLTASGREETVVGRGEARAYAASLVVAGGRSSRAGAGAERGRRAATRPGAAGEVAVSCRVDAAAASSIASARDVPTVLVLAAHAGAGASTIAVLIGEAASTGGTGTCLIDCADPARSGVAAASDTELGEDRTGWRKGRRGALEIVRPSRPIIDIEDVAPTPVAVDESELFVVDAGWAARDVLASASWTSALMHTAQVVLVCRATVPGVRQTEQLLAALPGRPPLIAAIGATKWPGVVTASCGPLLRAAREAGRLVSVPFGRRLDVTGLTAAPFSKQLAAAGRALVIRLRADLPDADPAPAQARLTSRRKEAR